MSVFVATETHHRKSVNRPCARWNTLIPAIREAVAQTRSMDHSALAQMVSGIRQRVAGGEDPLNEKNLVPMFGAVCQAFQLTLRTEPYDVQLQAGLALVTGSIAEMQTGEGKTIAAVAPAALRALSGKGVHIATVNSYLADRDAQQMRPVFELLGLSVGLLESGASEISKRQAYDCDITYGPGYEFGFDYLRDQIQLMNRPTRRLGQAFLHTLRGRGASSARTLQRGHHYAIVDEIDSVLIDEARVPLVLSGDGESLEQEAYAVVFDAADKTARTMIEGKHYQIDEQRRRVHLTDAGHEMADETLHHLHGQRLRRPWPTYLEQSLRAHRLLRRDVDYIVDDQRVHIVDENTGRVFPDRSWRDGLHQAVETKERVPATKETTSVARISRQRYFRLYEILSGMTGTARECRIEFRRLYGLPVVSVPLRKPCRRHVSAPAFFRTREEKCQAIIRETELAHETGRPVLVGTRCIEDSELLSRMLDERGISHQLLNGKQDEAEAQIVASAGHHGVVTIATNMAGRGTDIKLDEQSRQLGGLHVICAEPHDSPRIDRQLMGRAARQGDDGSFRSFVSAEDRLIQQHGAPLARRFSRNQRPGESFPRLDRGLRRLQKRMERRGFRHRQELLRHDRWMDDLLEKMEKDEVP